MPTQEEPNRLWDFLEKNLGKTPGECRARTPFDGEIVRVAYSSICVPGEDDDDGMLGKLRTENKKALFPLANARNEYLRKLNDVSASCFISYKELSEFTGLKS